jgi:hypothetical protein
MDWVEDEGGAPEGRPSRRALDDRFDQWVSRGRELVDGVSGTRPGGRPVPRSSGRGGSGRLEGLGRWVEGKLDWLLDDREDWREPWETDRGGPGRTSDGEGFAGGADPVVRRNRPPLDAISRRGVPAQGSAKGPAPAPAPAPARAPAPAPANHDWPEEEDFTVPRWRRQEPLPPAVDPLGGAASPGEAPGRPLPRSTRRR